MRAAVDSSVIVAALIGSDPDHEACRRLLTKQEHSIHTHALSETFSILTGGQLGIRVPTRQAAALLRDQVEERLHVVLLTDADILDACAASESRGVRGGAIYDYLHLVAARKAGADTFYTLNLTDFLSFHRPGDPEILHPNSQMAS
jgi:predicted nucleic acid-binding protein